jgi:hypothetical protein
LFSFEAYFRILWKVSIFHRKAISLNTHLLHLIGYGVLSISGKPIDTVTGDNNNS